APGISPSSLPSRPLRHSRIIGVVVGEQHGSWRADNDWDRHWSTRYEGRRVFAKGRGPWPTAGILTGSSVITAGLSPLLLDPGAWPAIAVVALPWLVVLGWVLLAGRGRIRITTHEVQIRNWRRTRVIDRGAIAHVVHVRALRVGGVRSGYIALL